MAGRKPGCPYKRFEDKYVPITESGCWVWMRNTFRCGYGAFSWHGENIGAHRAAWMLYKGEIPDGMNVLHKCDNRLCVNPDHLFLGNQKDNILDMVNKKRHIHGVMFPHLKLNDEKVREIRRRYGAGCSDMAELAREYGVALQTISTIIKRIAWKHVK